MRRGQGFGGVMMAAALCLGGCEDEPNAPPPVLPSAGGAAGGTAAAAGAAAAGEDKRKERVFKDSDFVESERNRDPFRSYAASFQVKTVAAPQRTVLMPNTAVDQMRLVAIVTGVDKPLAMLVDGSGVGHTTSRGDFIGRAEVVQSGGSESLPVTLNWRIDRIRPNEVVIAREDPSAPNRVPLTRVIPLREDEADLGTVSTVSRRRDDDAAPLPGVPAVPPGMKTLPKKANE